MLKLSLGTLKLSLGTLKFSLVMLKLSLAMLKCNDKKIGLASLMLEAIAP
jgi:hypothetical protein